MPKARRPPIVGQAEAAAPEERTAEFMGPHIFHIIDDYSPTNYGVNQVVRQLTDYLARQGYATTILTAGKAKTPVPAGVGLKEFPLTAGGRRWRYPAGLKEYLDQLGRIPDKVFHIHGVWLAPQWLAARAAARQGVAAMLTPHGMLEPWHWRDGRLRRMKKLIYWYSLAYPAFRRLSLIHAITPLERDNLAGQFPGHKIEVIPNAIDLTEADEFLAGQGERFSGTASPYLLFLGRLHPKKGLEVLIPAFAEALKGQPVRLLIAGPAHTPQYAHRLETLVRNLGLERQVSFLGTVAGSEKWQLYRNAWAFCAPSHSEVVGLVNLEAAALKTPVITTHETGLSDWEEGGGLLVHPQVAEVAQALKQVFSWSAAQRQERGRRLRQLVENRYSWEVVGRRWLGLYTALRESRA
jgi:glycosyltransferase involved in cell wall biosynthesis